MGFRFGCIPEKADAIMQALSRRLSNQPASRGSSLLQASGESSPDTRTIEQLLQREREDRQFIEQIARHDPLPNILKHLVDVIERQNPALRACFTLIRDGRVCYAIAPTLGSRFALAVEDVTAHDLVIQSKAPIIANAPAPDTLLITDLAAERSWEKHRNILVRHGLRNCWSVPVVSAHEPLGHLSVYTSLASAPTPEDISLLETVADQAAIAIDHQDLIERQAQHSLHDPLTLLPNRALLEDRFQHAIDRAQRGNWRVALFVINIDRFKIVNDSLGHGCGDELLRQIAHRLRQSVRVSDTVARMSADEFAVIAPELRDRDAAEGVARKLLNLLNAPFIIAGRELVTTSSLGAAIFPEGGTETASLYRAADRALNSAKSQGRNRLAFYDPKLNQSPVESAGLEMQVHLRRAIEKNELSIHYQPQFDSVGSLIAVEALLRWKNAKLGRISPAQFIPIAEHTGLIVPIGEWVLREACQQARKWSDRFKGIAPRLAVNVSALQFAQPHFLQTVQDVLRTTGLNPRLLEVELTESLLMQNTQDATEKLSALRGMGLTAAIDDFGTGYSSLAYLRRLPIDTLKIDRSFVSDVSPENSDDSATAVIRAILSMAVSLGLNVVAEGVETEAQRDFLVKHGCQLMQGYLYGRPKLAAEITKLLEARAFPTDDLALSA